MKVYKGIGAATQEWDVFVQEPGKRLVHLDPRYDLRNHSPDGFAWGYEGSGPAQLALALVADLTGDDDLAQNLYQYFKARFVAALPQGEDWTYTDEQLQKPLSHALADRRAVIFATRIKS